MCVCVRERKKGGCWLLFCVKMVVVCLFVVVVVVVVVCERDGTGTGTGTLLRSLFVDVIVVGIVVLTFSSPRVVHSHKKDQPEGWNSVGPIIYSYDRGLPVFQFVWRFVPLVFQELVVERVVLTS